MENLLMDFVYEKKGVEGLVFELTWPDRLNYAKSYTLEILKKVWPYILLGIGIGAWIHGYVPTDFLAKYANADNGMLCHLRHSSVFLCIQMRRELFLW
jgi:uncharacterized membrane protein YraQ (UPF0718 family)